MQTQSSITPQELHRRLSVEEPSLLIDVRTPGEYAEGHVPGAQLMPLDALDPVAFSRERGDDRRTVFVLCQLGGRAKKAIEKLERAGVQGCVLVEGGTQAWIDAGLPVTRGSSRVLPLMRQVQIVVGFLSALGAALALTVNIHFAYLSLFVGCGFFIAGITGFCGLALVLAKMPWNKTSSSQPISCCTTESQSTESK